LGVSRPSVVALLARDDQVTLKLVASRAKREGTLMAVGANRKMVRVKKRKIEEAGRQRY